MSTLYKSYDIRGVYPIEVNERLFYKIGLCMNHLGIKKMAVGRDARLSSQSLFNSFVQGLRDGGVVPFDIGLVSSPMLSFFCVAKKMEGAMITASHNPPEYNGIKFVNEQGIQLGYDTFLKKIEHASRMKPAALVKRTKHSVQLIDMLPAYLHYFTRRFKPSFSNRNRSIRVVFDFSNGVGGIPLEIIRALGIDAVFLNETPDGSFPHHAPDQTKPENLRQLQGAVVSNAADLGIMFDGDADRCAFVDELGSIIPLDISFLLLALFELENTTVKKPAFLFDLRFSKIVSEVLESSGAIPIIMRVGNPFYKHKLHEMRSALLAGELSGHIMYKEHFGIDDPLFASLKMIELLSLSDALMSQLVEPFKKYESSGEISLSVTHPQKVIDALTSYYSLEKSSHLDGLSVDQGVVWFSVRPSNTEPLVRVMIEGVTQKAVELQRNELVNLIREYDRE